MVKFCVCGSTVVGEIHTQICGSTIVGEYEEGCVCVCVLSFSPTNVDFESTLL